MASIRNKRIERAQVYSKIVVSSIFRCVIECILSFSSLKGYALDYVDLLLPTLKIGAISEKEFHSLISLAFCDVGKYS